MYITSFFEEGSDIYLIYGIYCVNKFLIKSNDRNSNKSNA